MKRKNVVFRFIVLNVFVGLLISSSLMSQDIKRLKFDFTLQPGFNVPMGLPSNSSAVIPQLGLDFKFGKFGFRITEQFFKTSPEFDIDGYLKPLGNNIIQTGVKEKSSNFLIGINPYLNLDLKDNITLQPTLGLKYLIQNGATNYVLYKNNPSIPILNYPDGDTRRTSFLIEPSVRAIFGKKYKPVRFYVEASYALAVSENKFSYSYRDLTGVVLPDGTIDGDMMEMAKTITTTEKIITSFISIGIGLELNLSPSSNKKKSTKVNAGNIPVTKNVKEPQKKDYKIYKAPQPYKPFDGSSVSKGDINKPIILTWDPVMPKPEGDVVYKIKVFEVYEGQSIKEASLTTRPLLEKKVTNQKYLSNVILKKYPILESSNYGWIIQATNKSGKPYGENNGTSNPASFNVKGNDIDIEIDSLSVECCEDGSQLITIVIGNTLPNTNTVVDKIEIIRVNGNSITPMDISSILTPSLPFNFLPAHGSKTFTGSIDCDRTMDNLRIKAYGIRDFNGDDVKDEDIDSDTLYCVCSDCDSIQSSINLNVSKLNNNRYNLHGNLDVSQPIYGVEFQVMSYAYSPSPIACSYGITKIEESGMIILPETTINGTSAIQVFNESISGSTSSNNNATKTVKLMDTSPLPTSIPVNLSIGLPGAIPGLDPGCCNIDYRVCIKYTIYIDAEKCNTCSYIECFDFTNQ